MSTIYKELNQVLPEFAKYFKGEKEDKGIKRLYRKGKLAAFCEKVVSVASAKESSIQKVFEKARKYLEKKDPSLLATKEKSETKQGKSKLYTVEITSEHNIKAISDLAKTWEIQAEKKLKQAKKNKNISKEVIEILKDLTTSTCCLADSKEEKKTNPKHSLYVAFDEHHEVLAMGTTDDLEKLYVRDIATSPRNVAISPEENPVRGGGTAIIARIAYDALAKGKTSVHLTSLDSPEKFYKKVGFEEDEKGEGRMILTIQAMKKLCEKTSIIHLSEEPNF